MQSVRARRQGAFGVQDQAPSTCATPAHTLCSVASRTVTRAPGYEVPASRPAPDTKVPPAGSVSVGPGMPTVTVQPPDARRLPPASVSRTVQPGSRVPGTARASTASANG